MLDIRSDLPCRLFLEFETSDHRGSTRHRNRRDYLALSQEFAEYNTWAVMAGLH